MDSWRPITAVELEALIEKQLADCCEVDRAVFERHRVPLRLAHLARLGQPEAFFVVAQRGSEVMYYEDIEEGFNFSLLTLDGQIAQHWCNQDDLKHVLSHWRD